MECLKFDNNARSIKICQKKIFFQAKITNIVCLASWSVPNADSPASDVVCKLRIGKIIFYIVCSMFDVRIFHVNIMQPRRQIVDILDLK